MAGWSCTGNDGVEPAFCGSGLDRELLKTTPMLSAL